MTGARRQAASSEELRLEYTPQPKQALLHSTTARQALYGGAAGGGKSRALRMDAVVFCLENPGMDAFLFRRTLKELENNHIRKFGTELPRGMANYAVAKKRLEFPNGSGINFCFCESEMDVELYQGAEMHWLGIDEAGQMTPYQLSYLKGRVRLGDWKPAKDATRLPRVVMTANPGGISHNYLKDVFMQSPPMQVFHDKTMRDPDKASDKGWTSIFIPAKMSDNAHLDEDYGAAFGGLPDWQQKALRDGDWDIVAGAFFDCFSNKNVIKPFEVPKHWTRFRACDYGHATPFWIGWIAVSDGSVPGIPEDALVVYREWYGSKGKNEGIRWRAEDIADRVKKIEKGERIVYGVADPSMWRVDSGPSAAEKMASRGVYWHKADNERILGWQEVYSRIRGIEHWPEGAEEVPGTWNMQPMLYIFDNCVSLLRCLPTLQHDKMNIEDVQKRGEDHPGDGLRYGCMSRPFVTAKPEPKRSMTAPLTFDDLMNAQPSARSSERWI